MNVHSLHSRLHSLQSRLFRFLLSILLYFLSPTQPKFFRNINSPTFSFPLRLQSVEAVRDADASAFDGAADVTSLRQTSLLDEKDATSLRHEVTLMQSTLEEKEVEVETLKKEVDSLNAFQVCYGFHCARFLYLACLKSGCSDANGILSSISFGFRRNVLLFFTFKFCVFLVDS